MDQEEKSQLLRHTPDFSLEPCRSQGKKGPTQHPLCPEIYIMATCKGKKKSVSPLYESRNTSLRQVKIYPPSYLLKQEGKKKPVFLSKRLKGFTLFRRNTCDGL